MTLFNSFNNYNTNLLILLYIISIILGVFIIISKNPIFSVLFLIGLFFTIALYLISIGLTFLGLSYLLVYVGAISILFLFILMLINIRISELITEGRNSIPLAVLTIVSTTYIVGTVLPYNAYYLDMINVNTSNVFESDALILYHINNSNNSMLEAPNNNNLFNGNYTEIINASIGEIKNYNWELSVLPINHVTSLGKIFYTDLYINIIIISLVLLLAMIGAIIITIKKDNYNMLNIKYKDDIIMKSNKHKHHNFMLTYGLWRY